MAHVIFKEAPDNHEKAKIIKIHEQKKKNKHILLVVSLITNVGLIAWLILNSLN